MALENGISVWAVRVMVTLTACLGRAESAHDSAVGSGFAPSRADVATAPSRGPRVGIQARARRPALRVTGMFVP